VGRGRPVVKDGRRMPYLEGPKVDAADVLADGRRFGTIWEFKQLLLKDPDQVARALAERLLTYATGGAPTTIERRDLDAMVGKIREKNYGLRTLAHAIGQSKPFQHK